MSLKRELTKAANRVLNVFDLKVLEKSKLPDFLRDEALYRKPSFRKTPLPPEAQAYLRDDHERLQELRERYRNLNHPAVDHSLWTSKLINSDKFNLQYFRGDNAYLFQYRHLAQDAELKYLLNTYYIQSIDTLHLLDKLGEDDLFGVHTFDFNQQYLVSRDLLDSIGEIYFLERQLALSSWEAPGILDIGAGYGRLAHRMSAAIPSLGRYLCVDAVAESTFICEFYLRFRDVPDTAAVVPLYDIEAALKDNCVNVAVNIHSFSECTQSVIAWWLDLLRRNTVRYLMIVPNHGDKLMSREKDGTYQEFLPLLTKAGYRLVAQEPKYLDTSLQRCMTTTPLYFYLFELIS